MSTAKRDAILKTGSRRFAHVPYNRRMKNRNSRARTCRCADKHGDCGGVSTAGREEFSMLESSLVYCAQKVSLFKAYNCLFIAQST